VATTRVQDGTRYLEFDGQLLGEATSDDGRSQRWTEVKIYKSDTGRYIVAKIGRSVVYHVPGAQCGKFGRVMSHGVIKRTFPENAQIGWVDFVPCRKCSPVYLDDAAAGTQSFSVEQTRHSAQVAESTRGLVEILHRRDDNDVTFLPKVARNALEAAAAKDPAIREAWLVQRV
jgi:hypothetical protein